MAVRHNLVGFAANDERSESAAAVGGHDDEVTVLLLAHMKDGFPHMLAAHAQGAATHALRLRVNSDRGKHVLGSILERVLEVLVAHGRYGRNLGKGRGV